MTIIANRVFGGEIPRAPADKLPADNAQLTQNCEFAYGELRPLRALFQQSTLSNSPKSIFSVDGSTFYSWPFRTKAWKGPVINDTYNRMYFTAETGGLKVARTSSMTTSGGEPTTSYDAGVPAVAAAPTFTLVDRTTIPDFPLATVRFYSYYEANGKRYEETQITSYTTVKEFQEYTFAIAAANAATVADVTTSALTTAQRTVNLSSYTVLAVSDVGGQYGNTISGGGNAYEIIDSKTIKIGTTTINDVQSIRPTNEGDVTPGDWLQRRLTQIGNATPTTATPSVRVDVYDTTSNTVIFSMSASSAVDSSTSDAIPGGVEVQLVKNGTTSGQWRLKLIYGAMDTRAYVVTMVNDFFEESKPSPPVLVSPTFMQSVSLTFTPPSFTGYVSCSKYRLYRSIGTGDYLSTNTAPQTFSGSPVTVSDTTVSIKSTDASLSSIGWDLPPAGLKGLTLLPNGFFAGFVGDTLYFSEPYRPWAWPYSMTFPVGLVGMRAIENSLVVTTFSYPYLVTGVHPQAMTQSQLSASQAGVSDHGMAVVGNTVAYISNDSLAVVRGFDVDLTVGQKLWTREVWKAKFGAVLSNLELAYHDGALVCGCPTTGKMWEIRLDGEGGGNLSSLSLVADALYVLPLSDQLYLVQGNQLHQYKNNTTFYTYDWWGKDYLYPRPIALTAGFINCAGSVTITVYADGAQRHQLTLTGTTYFRIPSGAKARRWSYRLTGSATVKELKLAERREELRGG